MKKIIPCTLLLASLFQTPVMAASEDECAAWICAAGAFAFPSCKPPLKAMIKRIKKFKPPLPALSSCGGNEALSSIPDIGGKEQKITYNYGRAAYIPSRRVCTRRDGRDGNNCISWKMAPPYYIRGRFCRTHKGDSSPQGCTSTASYIELFADGKLINKTFYW